MTTASVQVSMAEKLVKESQLWDGDRQDTHGFLLTPDVYTIRPEQKLELERLGIALSDSLKGVGRIAAIAFNPQLQHGVTWGMIARMLATGVPKAFIDLQTMQPKALPIPLKVDLMEGQDHRYYIAEIDGHNPRGLGYSTLAARIRQLFAPNLEAFPGVATLMAEEVRRRDHEELVFLYSDQERFYRPEIEILKAELAKLGINLIVVSELEVSAQQGSIYIKGIDRSRSLFVTLPVLYHNKGLRDTLSNLYRSGEISFLLPPKPFLGSKAVLALLRNDTGDREVEAILRSQIPSNSLETLRSHIPTTYMVSKKVAGLEHWQNLCSQGSYVLKATISSGMKGTIFNDDPRFPEALRKASETVYGFVLQKEVITILRSLRYRDEKGAIKDGIWYIRLIAHFFGREVGDLEVTGRMVKAVHGAKDSIMTGVGIR